MSNNFNPDSDGHQRLKLLVMEFKNFNSQEAENWISDLIDDVNNMDLAY